MRPDCHFERRPGLVVLSLLRVQHGEVVVGLGEFREIFGELLEHRDCLVGTIQLGERDAFEESGLRILRIAGQESIGHCERLRMLPLVDECLDFRNGIGRHCERRRGDPEDEGHYGQC
jgi:hypothetical protein